MWLKNGKKTALLILDGYGYRKEIEDNAVVQANTPFIDSLMKRWPNTIIKASGEAVGVRKGMQGNSDIGHLNIGAGRLVNQEVRRIDLAIENGSFFKN